MPERSPLLLRLLRALPSGREAAALSAVAVLAALVVGLAIIYATGKDGLGGYAQMFRGGLGGPGPIGETTVKAAVLIFTGLSVCLAFTVGLFNIGAEGQFIVGAVTAAWLGQAVRLPAALHVPIALAGAAAAGAAYGLVPALLKVRRQVHEVISTIMLNWVAVHLVENWLVIGPLKAPIDPGATVSLPGTTQIQPTAELPRLLGDLSRMNLGIVLAVACAAGCAALLSRTRLGFELRAAGLSPEAAKSAGIGVASRTCIGMALAGAMAALGGATLILGTELRYPSAFHSGYGFDGIAVSLIGGNHPFGVVAAAALFGALRAGATRLQLLEIHRSLPEVIQGLALLLVATQPAVRKGLARIRSRHAAREAPTDG